MVKRIVVTGGAGFVGSNLACRIARDRPDCSVVAFDNLKRRGSELTLNRLSNYGINFIHGDVRVKSDVSTIGSTDCIIECSAEPSVLAGQDGNPEYLIDTNLKGTLNCLEHLRRHGGELIFLSSSRVYSIPTLSALPLKKTDGRLSIPPEAKGNGWSSSGIAEDFSTLGPRSLYGSTKLAAEQFIEEYRALFGLKAVIYRCSLLTGPWQMGKMDQGVVALWLARHLYGGPLAYIGYGGAGHQVRDILHVDDLFDLISENLDGIKERDGGLYNIGGGKELSVSLSELTALCQNITGNKIKIASVSESRSNDIPYFVSDNSKIGAANGWKPRWRLEETLEDICRWLIDNQTTLNPIFSNSAS